MSSHIDGDYNSISRKRAKLDHPTENNNNRTAVGLFDLPSEIRLNNILQWLDAQGFRNYSTCSKGSYEDCKRPEMPTAATTFTVSASRENFGLNRTEFFLANLQYGFERGFFREGSRLKRMRVTNHVNLPVIKNRVAKPYLKGTRLQSVIGFDMSFSSSESRSKNNRKVAACLPRFVAQVSPSLLEADFSHAIVAQSALSDLARHCMKIRKITNHKGIDTSFLSGQDLMHCDTLEEIYMDGTRFYFPQSRELLEMEETPSPIFFFIVDRLKRVSLVDVTYYQDVMDRHDEPLTQIALMKFVRTAQKLEWFRSNLTSENVEILKKERPNVTFVSPNQRSI